MAGKEKSAASSTIELSDEDISFLFAVLRDATRPQPITTQQLIDALRSRATS